MDNTLTDENVLFEDCEVAVPLGAATVNVRALNIESSVQWQRRVWARKAESKNPLSMMTKDVMDNIQSRIIDGLPTEQAVQLSISSILSESMPTFAGEDVLALRDLLVEHSPKVFTKSVLAKATVLQIAKAFRTVWSLENPQKAIAEAMNPM